MLGDQQAGYFLLFVHIISSVLVGILFRFYGKESAHVPLSHVGPVKKLESLGEIFGSSISNSMDTIVQIGGYIILFSVIGALLRQSRIIKSLSSFLYYVFKPLGMTMELAFSWIIGLIEISNGSSLVAQSQGLYPLKLGVLSFILGWGGLSIHAQSLNFTKKTKIKAPVYLFAKFLHGAIAFILTLVLYFLLAYFITS